MVIADEFENGERKLLNFGHTLGHAIENLYNIPHGHAISIGMGVAGKMSEQVMGFKENDRLVNLLKRYGLPPQFDYDKEKSLEILQKDKKKNSQGISYILLKKIGKAQVKTLSMEEVKTLIHQL